MSLTINDIQEQMSADGSHWFDPDTMRFHGTKVVSPVFSGPGGIYFATRDKNYDDTHSYTVRQYQAARKSINTIGDVGAYGSKRAAEKAAERMANEPLAQQYLTAIRALDEATTGATHGRTFDPARNYVSLDRFAAGDVASFPGDGGYTRCKRVEYSDGSGFCLELIQTGATDRAAAWSSAYKLQRELCRVAFTFAAGDYVDTPQATEEALRPITDAEQLLHDLHAHGCPLATSQTVRSLMAAARKHHRGCEHECNGDERGATMVRQAERSISATARKIGCGVIFSGDPRGCTAKLVMPDGHTNDFGREGLCIPR